MDKLFKKVEEIAKEKFDGHYSIFSFTTNYKGFFGTPYELDFFEDVPGYNSLEKLLKAMIKDPKRFSEYETDGDGLKELYQSLHDPECMGVNVYLGDGVYLTPEGGFADDVD